VPWEARAEVAYFRGSIFWYERHGRTRAFARSLVAPSQIDVDWYEKIDTSMLEADGGRHFGNLSHHMRHKYLLSLEGHSFWSFRLRHLMHLGSAVLHQVASLRTPFAQQPTRAPRSPRARTRRIAQPCT
jgi:hypothetical protein